MTTTRTKPTAAPTRSVPSPTPATPAGRPAPVRARRRPALIALGVLLVVIGVLATASLVGEAGRRTSVLLLARDVPFGATIEDADLTIAEVSVDPEVQVVPADSRDDVVGQVSAAGLHAGSLLAPTDVTTAEPPAPGEALVGLAVAADRMPAGGLTPGDRVLVVETPPAAGDPPTTPPVTIAATVVRRGEPDLNGVTVVDVTVPAQDGPALAARAATGRIAVVVQPRGR